MPVDDEAGPEARQETYEDTDEKQWYTRWVLDQNVVVRMERAPESEQELAALDDDSE